MSILGSCGKCGHPWAVHHQIKTSDGSVSVCPADASSPAPVMLGGFPYECFDHDCTTRDACEASGCRKSPSSVREVDRRLTDALIAAGRSALGMPGTVDTFKPWLEAAGLGLVLVAARRGA